MIVRRYGARDLEPVLALWRASRRRAHWHIRVHREFTEADDREFFVTKMLVRNELWVAEQGGSPLGFMAVEPGWINQL